jgi:scyllo-inositol 2-dehydrogenase (NADP+)
MIRAAIVGTGKMGLSHQSIFNAHPDISLQAVCDTSTYLLDILSKYTRVRTYTDYLKMLDEVPLDCVIVATPSRYHADVVRAALERGLHTFCEKPFGLVPEVCDELAALAEQKKLVHQVGYHYRFVAAFTEAKRLLELGVIGKPHHVRIEAYGPVVVRPKGSTWRSQRVEGGGCLFDYACHAIDLAAYLVGPPVGVSGTVLNGVFSEDVEDEVYSRLMFKDQLYGELSANWSDESHRKMSVRLTFWGTNGRINVDRQELQVYLRDATGAPQGLKKGWNIRYTTELTRPVWFYVRGEEYSAQVEHFVECIKTGATPLSNFRTAADTVRVAVMMRQDAETPFRTAAAQGAPASALSGTADRRGGTQRLSILRTLMERSQLAGRVLRRALSSAERSSTRVVK